jgi:hypothetical protein
LDRLVIEPNEQLRKLELIRLDELPAGCAIKIGLIEDDANGVRLVKAMEANPGANVATVARAIGKSRTSTVNALHRLRDAGLTKSLNGIWTLTEPPPPKETPRWTAPVSAQRRRVETEEREHA